MFMQPSVSIPSLLIGGHPYESWVDYRACPDADRRYPHRPSDPAAMPYNSYWNEDGEQCVGICSSFDFRYLSRKASASTFSDDDDQVLVAAFGSGNKTNATTAILIPVCRTFEITGV